MNNLIKIVVVVGIFAAFIIPPKEGSTSKKPRQEQAEVANELDLQAIRIVKSRGLQCDSFSDSSITSWNETFHLYCDNYRNSYSIKKVAGYWKVEIN